MYPRLFTLGPVTFPTYGFFAAVALVAGLGLAMRTAARMRIHPGAMWNFGVVTILAAVLGSKVLLIAGHWHDFLSYPILMLSITVPQTINSVLTEIGLGISAGLFYLTLRKMPWLETLDAAAPGWALGQAILALGAFFAGSEYGRPTTVPWGVVFHSHWAMLWNGTPLDIKLHPVQLYLCAVQLLLCLLLLWWLPRRRQPGELIGGWLLFSGLAEFFLNFYRGDNHLLILGGAVSLTQAIDFSMVILGALLLLEQRPMRETAR